MFFFFVVLAVLAGAAVVSPVVRLTDDPRPPHLEPPRSTRDDG